MLYYFLELLFSCVFSFRIFPIIFFREEKHVTGLNEEITVITAVKILTFLIATSTQYKKNFENSMRGCVKLTSSLNLGKIY